MTKKPPSELRQAIAGIKSYFLYAALFSAAVNILMLVPIIYMLQVYDRVVTSRSLPTLLTLTLIMIFLLASLGGFEWIRARILINASNVLEKSLHSRVVDAMFRRSLLTSSGTNSVQPVNDLTGLRQFLTGNGMFAFFDAPWFPIYILLMFMFHPWFGVAGIVAGIVIVALAYANEEATSKILQAANLDAARNTNRLTGNMRNVEVIEAMGMTDALLRQQIADNNKVLALQSKASRKGAALSSTTRAFRIIMQSSMLCVGALLVLRQDISPGVMIAGSLLLGRALAPLDVLVATWKNFAIARSQFQRLEKLLQETPAIAEQMKLPAPSGKLQAEKLVVVPPGSKQVVLHHVGLSLEPGESLGIIGPSAAGKTSLLRTLLGIWKPAQGCVRLDGADVAAWNRAELGQWLGYLPQDIELFDGKVAQNICRFGHDDPDQIVAAAKLADIHEMILSLPDGYDTVIGGKNGMLSGGQRQRIGLARAVYGDPRLLILDEPNSNLDDRGELALIQTLRAMKAKGVTVVVASHRPSILFCLDKIMVMQEGRVLRTDSSQEILNSLKNLAGASAQETGQSKGSVA